MSRSRKSPRVSLMPSDLTDEINDLTYKQKKAEKDVFDLIKKERRSIGGRSNTNDFLDDNIGEVYASDASIKSSGGAGGPGTLVIKVTSAGYASGEQTEITVNGKAVKPETNENGHFRGLHIVLINPLSGKVELSKVFDTYSSPGGFEYFIQGNVIPLSYIVVAACQDDCSARLSPDSKSFFQQLGSL